MPLANTTADDAEQHRAPARQHAAIRPHVSWLCGDGDDAADACQRASTPYDATLTSQNWTATIVFCGGTNLQPDQWVTTWNIAAYPADNSCISITPDVSTAWQNEDTLPEGRSMGNFILLPDGRGVILNGQLRGTAGYGNTSWAIGQSFGDGPIYAPLYYDRSKPQGQRMTRAGMGNSTVPRMYHSSALLLPDGSIFSSGSNPNADFISAGTPGYPYPTEYRCVGAVVT